MIAPFLGHQIIMNDALARIEDQIVAHLDARATLHQHVALVIVGIEIVHDQDLGGVVVDERTFGMLDLAVRGPGQALGRDVVGKRDAVGGRGTPLVGRVADEAPARDRHVLVGGPGERAVIGNHVHRAADGREGVFLPAAFLRRAGFTDLHADVLEHDVVRADVDAAADQSNARRRGGLAGNRDVVLVDGERLPVKIDHPADFEYDDARSLGIDGRAQRARPVIGQGCYLDDLSAASALGRGRPPHGPRKRQELGGGNGLGFGDPLMADGVSRRRSTGRSDQQNRAKCDVQCDGKSAQSCFLLHFSTLFPSERPDGRLPPDRRTFPSLSIENDTGFL